MSKITRERLAEIAKLCQEAIAAGHEAADALPNDGGSANLDHVVLTGLRGVRESSIQKAGIPISFKDGRWAGWFHLQAPFRGMGDRNYAGVQAMAKHLSEAGVQCHVHYQLD